METEVPKSVACAERVRMNAIAALLFIIGGDGILLVAVMSDRSGTIGATITGIFGILAILIGFYYMLCFLNKAIVVSDKGVLYRNWTGKKLMLPWEKVSVSHHAGRNAYFTFDLDGKKVTFYGYAKNALALHEYLLANERYDNDTMRQELEAIEKREQMIREMQKKAQSREYRDEEDE